MRCFVHKVSYYVKRLCYYVKKVGLSFLCKHANLSIQTVIMLNARVVLSTQCFIVLKDYISMINTYAVFSTQCPIM